MAEEATAAEVPTDAPKANAQEESANDTAQQALDLARQAAALKVADATADGGNGAGGGSKKKKKKKKGKKKAAAATVGSGWDDDDANAASGGADSGPIDGADGGSADAEEGGEPGDHAVSRRQMMEALYAGHMRQRGAGAGAGKPESHKFWDTQPVPKMSADVSTESARALESKTVDDVRKEPYAIPGLEWVNLNVADDTVAQELFDLLTQNYVEDDDNMFRFAYSVPFLRWATMVPGYHEDWIVGVRSCKSGKLMACITGIPQLMKVRSDTMPMAEINFLCVHKKLRAKRLAPVLIKEVTRRINLKGIFQAVYTAGVVLPKPVASCRYWHRSLNPKKLIEVGFSRLAPRMTMGRTIKLHKLPEAPITPGIAPMTADTVEGAYELLSGYLKTFDLAPQLNLEEFSHVLMPREGVVSSYVVQDPATKKVTDFCSFYHLPSSIIGHEKHSVLNAAYSYYNVATTVPLKQLMNDLLIFAKQQDFDVFNALDIMENGSVLKDLKFGIGDGHLQYYIYNWMCPEVDASQVGLVLL